MVYDALFWKGGSAVLLGAFRFLCVSMLESATER
jgi:hypothetical protein